MVMTAIYTDDACARIAGIHISYSKICNINLRKCIHMVMEKLKTIITNSWSLFIKHTGTLKILEQHY